MTKETEPKPDPAPAPAPAPAEETATKTEKTTKEPKAPKAPKLPKLPQNFKDRFGPWAVVTGASSGIGSEFARQLAAAGLSVVIAARRKERLDELAASLSENHSVQTRVIVADLGKEEGWQAVVSQTKDLEVGLLVNNAGMEAHGSFFREPIEKHVGLVAVNVTAVTALSHAFGRRFADKGKGGIIFVSSMLSKPSAWATSYSSSKSYVTSLALTLRDELKPKGVTLTVLEPGVVKSEMTDAVSEKVDFKKAGLSTMLANQCVGKALSSFSKGKARVTPGIMNNVMFHITGALPTLVSVKMSSIMMKRAMDPELCKYA